MKVKIVENGVEKLVEASYIIIEGETLASFYERFLNLEALVSKFIEEHNKREKHFQKVVEKL